MKNYFDFYDNHDGDEFIQYKKCKHKHEILVLCQINQKQGKIYMTVFDVDDILCVGL